MTDKQGRRVIASFDEDELEEGSVKVAKQGERTHVISGDKDKMRLTTFTGRFQTIGARLWAWCCRRGWI